MIFKNLSCQLPIYRKICRKKNSSNLKHELKNKQPLNSGPFSCICLVIMLYMYRRDFHCLANLGGSLLHSWGSWRPVIPSLFLWETSLLWICVRQTICTKNETLETTVQNYTSLETTVQNYNSLETTVQNYTSLTWLTKKSHMEQSRYRSRHLIPMFNGTLFSRSIQIMDFYFHT